ncbi:GH11884 [Drosophila grimshawi]|uniref:GH11884 n=2 Tax=Drosophila grimshawi TaxID=7222 RepID=B4JLE7_DROGR|nr:GH11884 [Drosophila grimshawi]
MADYSSKKNQPKEVSFVSKGDSFQSSRPNSSAQRQILREDNMWKDPQRLDTKWLRSRDPWCFKPDFRQTEPQSLRKQFMRSPDERARDAMNGDWVRAVRNSANIHRQTFIANQKRDQEEAQNQADAKINREQSVKSVKRNYSRKNKDN